MPTSRTKTPAEKKEAIQRAKQRQASIDLAWQFREENKDLPISPSNMGIWFDPSGHLDGTLNMTVQIPPNLTWRQYRDAWPAICAWRERLTKRTGIGKLGGKKWLYQELVRLKAIHSYATIARLMNERILRYLKWIHEAKRTNQTAKISTFHMLIMFYFSALHVRQKDLLHDESKSRLSATALNQWYEVTLALMREHESPFAIRNGPITERHVIDRIRQFRVARR